jgi:hypothetical protein
MILAVLERPHISLDRPVVDVLADRWADFDRLDPVHRAQIDETRLLPVDETRRLLAECLRVGFRDLGVAA